ncbi:MAG TPA: diguanylate cyclase [Methyloceanibacter sp.]|nr:diguanylate cyclase [Methyloceanibacter sp.]
MGALELFPLVSNGAHTRGPCRIERHGARRHRQPQDNQRSARAFDRRCGGRANRRCDSPEPPSARRLRQAGRRVPDHAPDCSKEEAVEIAEAILRRLAKQGMPLVGAAFSVSIGIAAHEGGGADYARIHREADAALHQARAEGRNRLVVYDATTAPPLHSDHPPQVLV